MYNDFDFHRLHYCFKNMSKTLKGKTTKFLNKHNYQQVVPILKNNNLMIKKLSLIKIIP
jgi:hypothetical protein